MTTPFLSVALARLFFLTFLMACPAFSQTTESADQDKPKATVIANAERAFTRSDPVPTWVRPIDTIPTVKDNGSLSIRLADIQLYVGDESVAYMHRAVTANEASSLGTLGQLEIEFQPEYQRVQLHRVRILRGKESIDKLADAEIRFLQRETELDHDVYSGTVTAAIVTRDVRVGDTVDIEYSILGQNPVFGGKYFYASQWDFQVAVGLRHVSINMPESRVIHSRLVGNDARVQPKLTEQHEGGRHIIQFEQKNLPATLGEVYVPTDVHQYRWLQFSELDTWKELNRWALDLFDDSHPKSNFQDILKSARSAKTSEEAVAKVLEFVQNDIRYLSISLGQNSHRPFPPDLVLARRYGDCKDKTLLMVSLLRTLKIRADPVLVSTYFRKKLDGLLPSPLLFDHAIVHVVVNGKEYYLDPTRLGQYGDLDQMGQVHAGDQVLIISPETRQLSNIASPDMSVLSHKRIERFDVSDMDKPTELTVRSDMTGYDAEYTRVQLATVTKEQMRKSFESSMAKRYPDARLIGDPIVTDHRERNQMTIETHYKIDKLFSEMSGGWTMSYTPTNMSEVFYASQGAKRDFPFAVPNFPSHVSYEIVINLPDQFDIPSGQSKADLSNSAFTMSRWLTVGGNVLKANFTMDITADRVQPQEMSAYLADIKKLDGYLNGSYRVFKSDTKLVAQDKGLINNKTLEEKLKASLEVINRTISNADITGRDTSDALCERALVRAYLGQEAEAIKDANKAVQLQSQSADMLKCRADTNFVIGKFKQSEVDLSKSISRGNDSSDAYFRRAINAFYLGRPTQAKVDFEQAAAKASESIDRTRALIWQGFVAMSLNAAMPAMTNDAETSDAWLSGAQAMIAGQITPEHFIGLASKNAGRELDIRLTEAYFYVGKYFALKHEPLKSRVYLQRVLDKKMIDQPNYTLARYELDALK